MGGGHACCFFLRYITLLCHVIPLRANEGEMWKIVNDITNPISEQTSMAFSTDVRDSFPNVGQPPPTLTSRRDR